MNVRVEVDGRTLRIIKTKDVNHVDSTCSTSEVDANQVTKYDLR